MAENGYQIGEVKKFRAKKGQNNLLSASTDQRDGDMNNQTLNREPSKIKVLLSKQYREIFKVEKSRYKRISPRQFYKKYVEVVKKNGGFSDKVETEDIRRKLDNLIKKGKRHQLMRNDTLTSIQHDHTNKDYISLNKEQLQQRSRVKIGNQLSGQKSASPKQHDYQSSSLQNNISIFKSAGVFNSARNSIDSYNDYNSLDHTASFTFITGPMINIDGITNPTANQAPNFSSVNDKSAAQLSTIKQKCSNSLKSTQISSRYSKNINKEQQSLNDESKIIQNSISSYLNIMAVGDESHMKMGLKEIQEDINLSNEQNFQIEKDVGSLDKELHSQRLNRLLYGRNRKLWKPDKFKVAQKFKISDDINQLLRR